MDVKCNVTKVPFNFTNTKCVVQFIDCLTRSWASYVPWEADSLWEERSNCKRARRASFFHATGNCCFKKDHTSGTLLRTIIICHCRYLTHSHVDRNDMVQCDGVHEGQLHLQSVATFKELLPTIWIRPATSLTAFCAWDSSPHLLVTPAQLIESIGWNTPCAVRDLAKHLGLSFVFREIWFIDFNVSCTCNQNVHQKCRHFFSLGIIVFNVHCQLENEKLLHEQSVKELEAQIKSHEGRVKGMEVMLREKEESLLESSKALRIQRQKAHKVTDKVLTSTLRFQTSSYFTPEKD